MDRIIAPSRFLADVAGRNGIPGVQVLPHGVGPCLPRDQPSRGPFVFLGSILPHKGPHLVVEAYKRAFPGQRGRGSNHDQPGLEIYGPNTGDPAYSSSLAWPLEGPVLPREVPGILRRARALVMGSTWPENAPLVVLEARACGCPVIAPATGGIPELLEHGRDGYLYRVGDIDDLAHSMLKTMLGPGTEVSPPPSLEQHVDGLLAVYNELLGQ